MSDNNLVSFADQSGLLIEGRVFLPSDWLMGAGRASVYDDTWKLSHTSNSVFRNCKGFGGNENAIDLNRMCENVRFEACELIGGDQAAIVIKGGCKNIVFPQEAPTYVRRDQDSWCDVLLDDWSDQSRNPSRGIDLRGLRRKDGAKVRIVVGRGWGRVLPLYDKQHAEILILKSAGVHFYNLGKGIFLSLRK